MRPLIILALALAAPAAGMAQLRRLPPVDRCASDPSFVRFRSQLVAAIARRDAAFLLAAASDDIASDAGINPRTGRDGGKSGFARYWGLDRPERSHIWRELGAALRLGCARARDGTLWVPSMSLDEDAPDDATHGGQAVAVSPGAALRAAPSERARVVASLRWDIVVLMPDDDGRGAWARVQMSGRRGQVEGFVRRRQIRMLADRTAYFQRRQGRWRLVGFVLGDEGGLAPGLR